MPDVAGVAAWKSSTEALRSGRAILRKPDPFTRRRLLDLDTRYELQGNASGYARSPAPRATPPNMLFSGSGDVSKGGIAEIRCN